MNFNLTTQMLGVLCFTSAALSCGLAWRRTSTSSRIWAVLMLLHAGLVLEVLVQFRHLAAARLRGLLREAGFYYERVEWQMVLIMVLLICVVASAGWLILSRPRRAGRPAGSAVIASICALCFFGLELISLHSVEAVLYRPAGPGFMIGWAWATCTLIVCLAAFRATWQQ